MFNFDMEGTGDGGARLGGRNYFPEVVRTLVARGLITEMFTDAETGAIHYGTTDALLTNLGINSLDELPPISPLLDDGTSGFGGIPGFDGAISGEGMPR